MHQHFIWNSRYFSLLLVLPSLWLELGLGLNFPPHSAWWAYLWVSELGWAEDGLQSWELWRKRGILGEWKEPVLCSGCSRYLLLGNKSLQSWVAKTYNSQLVCWQICSLDRAQREQPTSAQMGWLELLEVFLSPCCFRPSLHHLSVWCLSLVAQVSKGECSGEKVEAAGPSMTQPRMPLCISSAESNRLLSQPLINVVRIDFKQQ